MQCSHRVFERLVKTYDFFKLPDHILSYEIVKMLRTATLILESLKYEPWVKVLYTAMQLQLARKMTITKHCLNRVKGFFCLHLKPCQQNNSIVYVQKMGLYARINDLHYAQQMGLFTKYTFQSLTLYFGFLSV